MRMIEKLIDDIMDEINGAEEYAERYIECKARGNNARAAKYKEMAYDELRHAESVYEFAEADMENIRKVYAISVEDEEAWSHAKKLMHQKIAQVRIYVS